MLREPLRVSPARVGVVAAVSLLFSLLPTIAVAQVCGDPFNPSQVLKLYITMASGDWNAVLSSCPGGFCGEQPYLYYHAFLRCETGAQIEVGIRRKNGLAEPSNSAGQKPPLKIDINEFVPNQLFFGKTKLSLENGAEGSLVTEGLSWRFYNATDIPSSRVAWVDVYVNGAYKGLYANVEQIDKEFLVDHGIDDGGWLFKVEEQRTREGEPNPYAFNWYPFDHPIVPPEVPTPPDWRTQALARVDMTHLLTLAAAENYVAGTDGAVQKGTNYWYYDWSVFPAGQQPRLYLAWDLDTTMRNAGKTLKVLGSGLGHLRQGILVGDPGFQADYLTLYNGLVHGSFSLSQALATVSSVEAAISARMNADPYQTTGTSASEFQRIRTWLQARVASVQAELGACPNGTCNVAENSCTCPADCGAPPASETACANSLDDDCDGAKDCSDSDCGADPACAPTPQPNRVLVSEVLANTSGAQDVEFVEIYNAGPEAQDLTGWYILDDDNLHPKCFLEGTLGSGEYLVIPGLRDAFMARFPEAQNLNPNPFDSTVSGQGFSLANGGDEVRMFKTGAQGDTFIHGVTMGVQGQEISFGLLPQHTADAPEYLAYATPGVTNDLSKVHSPVCINEFLTTSQSGGVDDWVELYNRSTASVNIGGWSLSDTVALPRRYVFPANTVIPPAGFLTVDETQLGFSFSSTGSEVIMLTHSDGVTGMDYFDYGPQFPDVTQGRFPNGSANWQFSSTPTRNTSNVCAGAPISPVPNLGFDSGTMLAWDPVAGAAAYDIIKGDLGLLRATGGAFNAAGISCHADDVTGTRWSDASVLGTGEAWFYLVRGVDFACGFGTYDSGAASQVGARDAGITASGAGCP